MKIKRVTTNIVYIGLGSNIEQPYQQIKKAIAALDEIPDTRVIKDSGYFKSRPMGPKDQPDYVNAVVELETALEAADLLEHCQLIEKQQGRIRSRRWGERSIDLDVLLYAEQQIKTDKLTVPHPGICQRDFVYMPLLKLNPAIEIPGEGMLDVIVSAEENFTAEESATDYGCQYAGNIDR